MKKLLSLLSFLTISGAKIPMVVAAAPYQQTNNLETLHRNKRESSNILRITEKLEVDDNDRSKYVSSFNRIINFLIENEVLEVIFQNGDNDNQQIFQLRQNNFVAFILPVAINNNVNIELVFLTNNLYINGVILNQVYYHFDNNSEDTASIIRLLNITHNPIRSLGDNYNDLFNVQANPAISWENITNAFFQLSTIGTLNQPNNNILGAAWFRVALVTAEALRFRSIYELINTNIIENYGNIYWNPEEGSGQTNIRNIVTNWSTISNNIIHAINNMQARFSINNEGTINDWFYHALSRIPIITIAQYLANTDVRIVLGLIMGSNLNCNIRQKRSKNINFIKKYCNNVINKNLNDVFIDKIKDIKIDKNKGIYVLTKTGNVYFVPDNDQWKPIKINSLDNKFVTSMGILENDSPVNSNLKAGTIYFGTTDGVYLSYERQKNNNAVSKIEDLNEEVNFIVVDDNGSAHVSTKTKKVYVIKYNSWKAVEEINIKNPDEKCGLKKYLVNHFWSWNWKNLIPFYGFYHVFTCSS